VIGGMAFGWYDYGTRFYDPEIGRFHSIDKMSETTPNITPYRYAFNNPLRFIDVNGNFEMDASQTKQYQRLAQYLKYGIQEVANNPKVMGALMKYG
jgi:RHS repeat-associated core domain